ncbi:MAG: hypothetical protein AAF591_05375 [Verrucomicrobiota bacterium]
MLRPLGRIASILVLVCIANGHWGIVQGVAWANMIRDRAPDADSFSALVAETITGTAPCHLCLAVTKNSQNNSDDPDAPSQSARLSPFCPITVEHIVLSPPRPSFRPLEPESAPVTITVPPLLQPPRILVG